MVGMDNEHIENFDKALASWTDARFISAADIRTLAMFTMYIVNLADREGWVYRGHSWKESEYMGCLVVKAIVADIPSVVFTSAKTYMGGIRVFFRKMEADLIEWVPDRFA